VACEPGYGGLEVQRPGLPGGGDDGSGQRVVCEQACEIYVITADGERLEAPFLALREQMVTLLEGFDERGLLGLAFHPDFAENGLFYVNYSAKLRSGSAFTGETVYTPSALRVPIFECGSRPRRPGFRARLA
jgi:Glucose / Sorbosone dehydrogenase